MLWSIRRSYSAVWSLPLTNVKWHCDHWPVAVTPLPIRLNQYLIHDLDTELDFHQITSVFHGTFATGVTYQQGMHVYPSGHRVPSLFGTCLCSNCCDQFSRTCVFSRFFTLNIPRYFLDFAYSTSPFCIGIELTNFLWTVLYPIRRIMFVP